MSEHTKERIIASLCAKIDAAFDTDQRPNLEWAETQASKASEDAGEQVSGYLKSVVGRSLWRLLPGIRALHAYCLAGGHTSEATAREVGGLRAFAVPTSAPDIVLLACVSGEGRHLSFIAPHSDDKLRVCTGTWKPDAGEFLRSLPSPLPTALEDGLALAKQASAYADIGALPPLVEAATSVAEHRNRLPLGINRWEATFWWEKESRAKTVHLSVDPHTLGSWAAYAKAMAPVAALAPPDCAEAKDYKCNGAEETLALDGGVSGPAFVAIATAAQEHMLARTMQALAPTAAAVSRALAGNGLVWGEKSITHNGMRAFAIPTNRDDLIGHVHHNYATRYAVFTHLGADGEPVRLQVYSLFKPLARMEESWGEWASADHLNEVRRLAHEVEDPTADPARLTQAEFLRRLADGEALPRPNIDADLVSGTVETCDVAWSRLTGSLAHDVGLDLRALRVNGAGPKNGYDIKVVPVFGDEDYVVREFDGDECGVPASATAPGRGL